MRSRNGKEGETVMLPCEDADGRTYYITAYTMADKNHVWLLMETGDYIIWLY